MQTSSEHEYAFGPFRLIPARQLLLQGGEPLRLGARALDILQLLVERHGELVGRRELLAYAWPNSVVEDNNLKVHIAALRRALGEGLDGARYIATVSGRGYRFVAPVSRRVRHEAVAAPGIAGTVSAADGGLPAGAAKAYPATAPGPVDGPAAATAAAAFPAAATPRPCNLPIPTGRTIGRAAVIEGVLQALSLRRFVSVVGPGGIGKTRVAVASTEAFINQTGIDACFVDLSALGSGGFVPGAVAAALGLSIQTGEGIPALIANLRNKRLLLVLDSCEHVVDSAAVLAEQIVNGAPGVMILATSREPLCSAGEHVYRLAPLAYPQHFGAGVVPATFPAAMPPLTAVQASDYPAMLLFAERAAERLDGYTITDADAPAVAEICRRLEGIALAIELAATRVDTLGVHELAARLDDRLQLLKLARRSAQPRHSTLAAALDWSYEILPPEEQQLLCALSVFVGAFTLDAAIGLCGDDEGQVIDGIANLVAKSLLSADISGPVVLYRLLDTTKAYALKKLDKAGQTQAMRRRHALLQGRQIEQAVQEWKANPPTGWLASHVRSLDDVRAALAWAYSPSGDAPIGTALTIAAIPLWMQLSLHEECRRSVERALAGDAPDARSLMQLYTARAMATLYTSGPVDDNYSFLKRGLELADALGDSEYQLRNLWAAAVHRCYLGDADSVRALADRYNAIAQVHGPLRGHPNVERLYATALHLSGMQAGAREGLERILRESQSPSSVPNMMRVHLDQRATALGVLAMVLWLQGFPEQARQAVEDALHAARESGHMPSLQNCLAQAAFPVAMYTGDLDAAAKVLEELDALLACRELPVWNRLRRCLHAVLHLKRGDEDGLPLLQEGLRDLRATGFRMRVNSYLGIQAAALGRVGWHDEGLACVDEAIASCEAGEERWCLPELLRIKGELLAHEEIERGRCCMQQALELARQQGALAWELRAANSLARLDGRDANTQEGLLVVASVYARFTEGGINHDLREARELLDRSRTPLP